MTQEARFHGRHRANVSGLAVNIHAPVSCMIFCWLDLGVELLGHILCR